MRERKHGKPLMLIVNKEGLAEKLYQESFSLTKTQLPKIPFHKTDPSEQEKYHHLAEELLERYSPKKLEKNKFEKSHRLAKETAALAAREDLQTLEQKMHGDYKHLPEEKIKIYAKSLFLVLKDQQFAERLDEINQEILEFEFQRQSLQANQIPFPLAPNPQRVKQWMIEMSKHQTENQKVIKFIEKTEQRICENLCQTTEENLRREGLHPHYNPKRVAKASKPPRHETLEDIPVEQMPLVEALAKNLKDTKKVPAHPLLATIKTFLLGAPSTNIPPVKPQEKLRESQQKNIKEGRKTFTQGTHSLENPFPLKTKGGCPDLAL